MYLNSVPTDTPGCTGRVKMPNAPLPGSKVPLLNADTTIGFFAGGLSESCAASGIAAAHPVIARMENKMIFCMALIFGQI